MCLNSVSLSIFLIILTVASVNATETERILPRLVGGTFASDGEFPYQVSLKILDANFCSGSLITKRHVLTAAHCLRQIQNFFIRLFATVATGTNRLDRGGQSHGIKSLWSHKKSSREKYDVGIITLRRDVKLSKFTRIIPLTQRDSLEGEVGTVSAWGSLTDIDGAGPNNLKKLQTMVVGNKKCQEIYKKISTIEIQPYHLCTFRAGGKGICTGDSGGPLVYNNTQVGIATGSIECASGYPDVFTNVFYFLDDIYKVIGNPKKS